MRFRIALMFAGLCLVTTFVVPASAGSPRAVRIVFSREDRTEPPTIDLWTMDALAKDQVRLTHDEGGDFEAAWSPNGTKIAWVHYEERCNCGPGQIMIMDADGSNAHPITNPGPFSRPSWSPDGERIAFTNDYSIWIMKADGTGAHSISPPGAFEFDPDWSPDGSTIVFAHSPNFLGFELATMSPDGSDRRLLTHTPTVWEEQPVWSPDGDRIAVGGIDEETAWHVYLADPETGDLTLLVEPFSLDPAWFPDGSRLAFYACDFDLFCGLAQVRVNGHALKAFGRPEISGFQPDLVIPTAAA